MQPKSRIGEIEIKFGVIKIHENRCAICCCSLLTHSLTEEEEEEAEVTHQVIGFNASRKKIQKKILQNVPRRETQKLI